MAHFLIYVGSENADLANSQRTLENVGLDDLIDGHEAVQLTPQQSPDGKGGLLFAWRKPGDTRFCYREKEQTWIDAVPDCDLESGRYMVGFWDDSPPEPQELMRNYPYPGGKHELGDREWLFPTLAELPREAVLMDDGTWKFAVQRTYYQLWIERETWAEFILDETKVADFGELVAWLLRCLKLNYRLTPEVADHIKLFDNHLEFLKPLVTIVKPEGSPVVQ